MPAANPTASANANARKIHKAKLAYAKFLRDLHSLSAEQKQLLDKEVKDLENKKISEIQNIIQSMDI